MTPKNWLKPLVMAVVLFFLAGFSYWYEYSVRPKNEEKETQSKKLFLLTNDSISDITIFQNGTRISLHCLDLEAKLCKPGDQSKWEITSPLKSLADGMVSNGLISSLNHIEIKSTIDLKEETPEKRTALLKEYKLDEAANDFSKAMGYVQIKKANGELIALAYGENYVTQDLFFSLLFKGKDDPKSLKPDMNSVYLLPTQVKESTGKDLTHWRNKKLFSFTSTEVDGFTFQGAQASVVAKKSGNDWTLDFTKPEKLSSIQGESDNIDNFLSVIANANGKEFKFDNKADPKAKAFISGLKKTTRIELRKGKESAAVELFEKPGKAPSLFAVVSNMDPVMDVELGMNNRFNKKDIDFRATKLLSNLQKTLVDRATFSWHGKTETPLVIYRKENHWFSEEKAYSFHPQRFEDFLDHLVNEKIEAYLLRNNHLAPTSPSLIVELSSSKPDYQWSWTFFKSGGKVYAKTKDGDTVQLPHAYDDTLPWEKKDYATFEKPGK